MKSIHINYDEGVNGDYMGEAFRIAWVLALNGHKNVTVNDLGNGAEVKYE